MSLAAAQSPLPELHRAPERFGPLFMAAAGAVLAVAGPALVLAIMAARGGTSPWLLPVALMTLMAAAVVIAMDLRYGLALFIVCAGLSPKLPGAGYDNLRVEDFLFVLIFGAWLARTMQAGKMPDFRSPITPTYLALAGFGLLTAVWGYSQGTMPDLKYSLLLQAKRLEYLFIFIVVASSVRTPEWLRVLTLLFVISGALAAIYGLIHAETDSYQVSSEVARVSGPEGENYNTLSGYLIVCVAAGIAATTVFRGFWRTVLIGATGLAGAGILFSFSREGLVMLAGSLGVFAFTRHRWVSFGAVAVLIAGLAVSAPLRAHLIDTVTKIQQAPTGDAGDNSLTARFYGWDYRLNKHFYRQPLFGTGAGSVGLSTDNEYVLRICESGLIGFGVFLAWLWSVGVMLRRNMSRGGITQALAVGGFAAFSGLLIQGMAASSFTTIRTMEPFWFLLGLLAAAVTLDRLQERGEEEPLTQPPLRAVTA